MINASISALSSYVPEKVLDNAYFESIIETSDEWITTRTGIKKRHVCFENESLTDMCVKSVQRLQKEYSVDIQNCDFILVATSTTETRIPSTASQVQNRLGIPNCGTLDITAACAGFVYGLQIAKGMIESGMYKKILVIGAEVLSRFTDYTDRTTCILFGDGAGAALVENNGHGRIYGAVSGTECDKAKELYLTDYQEEMNNEPIVSNNKIHQDGKKVFKWAVQTVSDKIRSMLEQEKLRVADIDWLILHSANLRIIEAIYRETRIPPEKVLESVVNYGNTSSATIPLVIHNALLEKKISKGDRLLLIGFGGGLTYAGTFIDW